MITKTDIKTALVLADAVYLDLKKITDPFIGLKKIKTISDHETDTQAIVLVDDESKKMYIVFRGTSNIKDVLTDIYCVQKEIKFGVHECKVHEGFYKAFCSVKMDIFSLPFEQYLDYEIVCIGHSLGGALATICALHLFVQNKISVISFGSPRVGDAKFSKIFNRTIKDYFRFVHDNDVVPQIPKINYKHTGQEIRVDSDGKEITYLNIWKRLLYWVKGKRKFDIEFASLTDHFMTGYVSSVSKWV